MSTENQREWTLPAAAGLAAIEAALLLSVIAFAGSRLPAAIFVAAKFPFCVWLLQRKPGAFFAVLLYELTGLGIALLSPGIALPLRFIEAALAATVLGLLWASARLFPSAELPGR